MWTGLVVNSSFELIDRKQLMITQIRLEKIVVMFTKKSIHNEELSYIKLVSLLSKGKMTHFILNAVRMGIFPVAFSTPRHESHYTGNIIIH